MNNYRNILFVVVVSVLGASLVFVFSMLFNKDGFVDNNKLFLEFTGTQELMKKAEGDLSGLHKYLDTLNYQLLILDSLVTKGKQIDRVEELSSVRYVRDSLHYVYQEQMEVYRSDIREQSWNLLNQYIIEFGDEKKYRYIFGANGTGTMMYGAERKDITSDVLEYVNEKYNGK
ncbi:MAG TPA: hypothetical protein VLZ75_07405 [Chitinophagales bacterium]|nr:hypothetical protein [Chitinophagales bacterium]